MSEMLREPDDARVTYPVRVLLDRIDKRLGGIEERLDDRVTLAVFKGMSADFKTLSGRVESLEDEQRERKARESGTLALVRTGAAVGGWIIAGAVSIASILNMTGVIG